MKFNKAKLYLYLFYFLIFIFLVTFFSCLVIFNLRFQDGVGYVIGMGSCFIILAHVGYGIFHILDDYVYHYDLNLVYKILYTLLLIRVVIETHRYLSFSYFMW